ncbi:MAG: TolC family protein [Thermodesulfobacteriota bacterium]
MLLCLISFLLPGPVAGAPPSGDPLPLPLTAAEAVRLALANNPDCRIGWQRIAAAEAEKNAARGIGLPQVSLHTSYDQTDNPMYSFGNILNQGAFTPEIDFNEPGRTDTLGLGVRLGYRLYRGGGDRAGEDGAGFREDAARMELLAVRQRLAFEVVRAVNLIRLAEGTVDTHSATVESIAAALGHARARHDEGLLLRADLLDLEVQFAGAEEQLVEARHALLLSRKRLVNLLGIDGGGDEIEIAAPAADGEQEVPSPAVPAQRPELLSLAAMTDAARARVRQAASGYYPEVDGYAGYGLDTGFVSGGSRPSWQAGVKMQFNLFDGRRTAAAVAGANAALAEVREQKRRTEQAILLEIAEAELSLKDAEQRLAVTGKTIVQAEESARINRDRFAEGLVLAADLIAVENRLTTARIRRAQALTGRRIAVADLRRACGLPQFDEPVAADAAKPVP